MWSACYVCLIEMRLFIIHRLTIGHTYLTHGHLLRRGAPPRCLACQVDLTFEHDCFIVFPLQLLVIIVLGHFELFSKVASRSLIVFIKETGFYRKI